MNELGDEYCKTIQTYTYVCVCVYMGVTLHNCI